MTSIAAGEYQYWSTVTPQDGWSRPSSSDQYIVRDVTKNGGDASGIFFDPSGLVMPFGPTFDGLEVEIDTSLWDLRAGQTLILYTWNRVSTDHIYTVNATYQNSI